MPLQSTSGAASYDAFGGGVAAVPKYIEDYFSTFLYQGTGASNTINNGIDLSTKGGLVWIKQRNQATSHRLFDTVRGVQNSLASNSTAATASFSGYLTAFNTNGFTVGSANDVNESGFPLTSWSWAKAPKFFDVVTYTGDGTSGKTISHSLGSAPGCIIVKRTDAAENWVVYHKYLFDSAGTYSSQGYINLNSTGGSNYVGTDLWSPTATTFKAFGTSVNINTSGATYVAYLFAHNAGGFGLTGTDNVISCGSYTGNGSSSGPTITLGYEPQWVMVKRTDTAGDWFMLDIMRGIPNTPGVAAGSAYLFANSTNAEDSAYAPFAALSATGFSLLTSNANLNSSGENYIYIAIRRGPMKVPTSGTSVFSPVAYTGDGTDGRVISAGITADAGLFLQRTPTYPIFRLYDRLRGKERALTTTGDSAEVTASLNGEGEFTQSGAIVSSTGNASANLNGRGNVLQFFKRAPSFFDEVCYTGDGTADSRTFTHNLGVTPQLVMVKRRSSTSDWVVTFNTDHAVLLNSTNADTGYIGATGNYANGILIGTNSTTLTQYSGASGNSACNASGSTYVAYLFATCAGVSKVFSYTGNGSSQTINCGFTAGARWVLIKRTDSTGDWYVWDSARGIVSGNDPHLSLNTSATEVTTDDTIDTDSTGFVVNQVSATNVNVSSATYIGIAIA